MIFAHFVDIQKKSHWIKTTEIYAITTRTNSAGQSFTIISFARNVIEVDDDVDAVLLKIDAAVAS